MNSFRKFITSGVGFAFLIVGTTGVLMKFFFKNHWIEDIHGWIGLGMFGFAILHIAQNWKSLRNHARDWRVFLLVLPILAAIAFLSLGRQRERGPEINPRQLTAKLSEGSLANVAKAFGIDPNVIFVSMRSKGLHVSNPDETIRELAQQNQVSTEGILSYFVQ